MNKELTAAEEEILNFEWDESQPMTREAIDEMFRKKFADLKELGYSPNESRDTILQILIEQTAEAMSEGLPKVQPVIVLTTMLSIRDTCILFGGTDV